jgi:hypothetical protein
MQVGSCIEFKFRLIWLNKYDQSQVPRVKKARETAVAGRLQQNAIALEGSSTASSTDDDDDDFFSGVTKSDSARRKQRLVNGFSDLKVVNNQELSRSFLLF